MLINNKIEVLKKQHKCSNLEIAQYCEMSRGGYETMLKNGDMKISTLQKIAEFFKVPISYFFNDELMNTNEKDKEIDKFVNILSQVIKESIKNKTK